MIRRHVIAGLALLVVLGACSVAAGHDRDESGPDPANPRVESPVERASVGGKYRKLLREIKVPQDFATYRYFSDYGHYEGTEWAGYTNLPPGYWVYVYPNWYIWGECTQKP
jgi:hypothetical protein